MKASPSAAKIAFSSPAARPSFRPALSRAVPSPAEGTRPHSLRLSPRSSARWRIWTLWSFEPVKWWSAKANCSDGNDPEVGLESALQAHARLGLAAGGDLPHARHAL